MIQQALRLDKEYNRGFRHGRLNVYNPGLGLYGEKRKSYKQGYKRGMLLKRTTVRFVKTKANRYD